MEQVSVNNMEELLQSIAGRKDKGGRVFLLFCGDVDEATGESWCSDCVKAGPIIDKVLKDMGCPEDVLIRCTVGTREVWKDPNNVFRKHPKLELKGVPTLMEWATEAWVTRMLGPWKAVPARSMLDAALTSPLTKYRNLAVIKGFNRDLNYTGIITDNWDDPLNLIPVVLCVLCLLNGLPCSFQAWWAIFNAAIIHPMDYIVGALARGPKYLADEYAVLDARFWPLDDPAVTWISYIEMFIMTPLCLAWYRGIVQKKWYRHYFGPLASAFQMMGTIIFVGTEWHMNFHHLPVVDWPPTFDSFFKIKYFWIIFVVCNIIWIAVPTYIYFYTFKQLSKIFTKDKKH